MIRCLHCHAETSNGLALCELCQRKVLLDLEFIPVYFRNLARWKPGRAGSRPVPGSRVLYDGGKGGDGDRVSRAIDEIGAHLVGWAESLADDRPGIHWPLDLADLTESEQAVRLCEIFTERLTSIATLGWCGTFARELGEHEAALRGLTETAVPGWYAGTCRQVAGFDETGAAVECGTDTYVVPGLTWVTCPGCGVTTYARDHLDVILEEARGWVAQPMRMAEALVAILDTEISVPRLHKRISKWGERRTGRRVTAIRRIDADGDEVGPKRFRLGEVLDLLLSEGPTRTNDKPEKVAAVS